MKGPEDVPSEAVRDFQASENTSLHSAESDLPKSDRPAEADATDIPASASGVVGDVVNEMTESQSPPVVVHSEDMPSLPSEADTKESVSIMKAITSLWADRSAALWKPLEYPLYFSD
jgi:1-phosphatidylinositol-3-phosphate 5-kinase